jgi:hypothetical protein
MAPLGRLAVVSLLLLALPLQALTAAYLDLRGPAHFHLEHDEDDHDHRHSHSHGQGHVAHHHHPPGDVSVVAVHEEDLHEAVMPRETTGWSGTMLVALLSVDASPQLLKTRCGAARGQERLLKTRFLERLERPPRTDLV